MQCDNYNKDTTRAISTTRKLKFCLALVELICTDRNYSREQISLFTPTKKKKIFGSSMTLETVPKHEKNIRGFCHREEEVALGSSTSKGHRFLFSDWYFGIEVHP